MSETAYLSIDETRRLVSSQLDPTRRSAFGQFMTPSAIATFMAGLFQRWPGEAHLLDPGAGIGSLSDAFTKAFLAKAPAESRLQVSAFEIETLLVPHLKARLTDLTIRGAESGKSISSKAVERDFVIDGSFAASFGERRYTHVILNPPYKKIGASSQHRQLLRKAGIETVNLYSAFLALSVALSNDDAEIVAIIPRSFCNGTYFRPFREWLLDRVALTHIHVFESRKKAFRDDEVLQENIIVRLVRSGTQGEVVVSTSHDSSFEDYKERLVPFSEIVKPGDAERFIHIPLVPTDEDLPLFTHTLADLGLAVSTGPVVDFRVKEYLCSTPTKKTAPLLYTHHFSGGAFEWPREHRKPNAIAINAETKKSLMPRGWYVITKRFSSKEERRRIVAHCVDPRQLPHELYGFENHLNVIHINKHGLSKDIARGLSLFLNSTAVDDHFRTFSGHTQVNATDLRTMRFPNLDTLEVFGRWAGKQRHLTQEKIDSFLDAHGK